MLWKYELALNAIAHFAKVGLFVCAGIRLLPSFNDGSISLSDCIVFRNFFLRPAL
jgi:hypothetical protein